MRTAPETAGYQPLPKDSIIDALHAHPGVVAYSLGGGEQFDSDFEHAGMAPLAAARLTDGRAELKMVVSPSDSPHVYGVVMACSSAADSRRSYYVTRLAGTPGTQAVVEAAVLPSRVTKIQGDINPFTGKVAWRVGFLGNPADSGRAGITYAGRGTVDLIAARRLESMDQQLDIPVSAWLAPQG